MRLINFFSGIFKGKESNLVEVEVLKSCRPFGAEVDPGAIIKIPVDLAKAWQDAGIIKVNL